MSTARDPDERALLFHVAVVADLLDRLLAEHLASVRLAPRAFEIATVLATRGPLAPGEIATVTGVPAPTISRLVAGMEADGLVLHADHPSDRRSRIVSLTADGIAAFEEAQAAFNGLYEAVADVLGNGAAAVDSGVRRLEWALRTVAGVPVPDPLVSDGPGEEMLRYPRPRLSLADEAEALDHIEWLRHRAELRKGPPG